MGWYIGATPATERRRVEVHSGVILATFAQAQEGLDIPRLSCLVLATPKGGNLEQAVGRVQRPCADKRSPIVDDVVDPYSIFNAFALKRAAFYRRCKYDVHREQLT